MDTYLLPRLCMFVCCVCMCLCLCGASKTLDSIRKTKRTHRASEHSTASDHIYRTPYKCVHVHGVYDPRAIKARQNGKKRTRVSSNKCVLVAGIPHTLSNAFCAALTSLHLQHNSHTRTTPTHSDENDNDDHDDDTDVSKHTHIQAQRHDQYRLSLMLDDPSYAGDVATHKHNRASNATPQRSATKYTGGQWQGNTTPQQRTMSFSCVCVCLKKKEDSLSLFPESSCRTVVTRHHQHRRRRDLQHHHQHSHLAFFTVATSHHNGMTVAECGIFVYEILKKN